MSREILVALWLSAFRCLLFNAQPAPSNTEAVPEVPGCLPAPHRRSLDRSGKDARPRALSVARSARRPWARHARRRMAAEYIATQFALDGLRARGRQTGTFFFPAGASDRRAHHRRQNEVPSCRQRRSRSTSPTAARLFRRTRPAGHGGYRCADCFVGYGIHAPEYNWDDYAGVDLKGKIALVIVNEPALG